MSDYSWVGPVIQGVTGIAGEALGGMSEEQQLSILRRAADEFGKIDVPTLEKLIAEEMGKGQLEDLQSDPELRALERQALDEILRVGRSGGLTLEDKANLEYARNNAARTARAGEDRIRDNMASRGVSGGGTELAMLMHNNDAASGRAHDASMRTAADAQRRALDSIMQGGRLAGQLRSSDYDERRQRASATDARTRYNLEARERARLHNAGLGQQNFENQLALASGRSGQAQGLAGFYGNQASDRRAMMAGLGKAGADYYRGSGAGTSSSGQSLSAPPMVQAPDEDWNNPYYDDPSKLRD